VASGAFALDAVLETWIGMLVTHRPPFPDLRNVTSERLRQHSDGERRVRAACHDTLCPCRPHRVEIEIRRDRVAEVRVSGTHHYIRAAAL
jgi:hypothetical protein